MKKLVLTANKVATIQKNLIDGLSIASGAKSSATYYHSRDEQTAAIRSNVQKLYNLSKELPLIVANQKGVTGKFIQEVLLNEFKNTVNGGACNIVNPIDWYDNGIGEKALLSALNNLNTENGLPYVLRLFVDMKKERVNNERARKIILGFLLGHSNLEFFSLKYRNKIANVLRHVYGDKMTSVLISIAKKAVVTQIYQNEKELGIANDYFLRYTDRRDDVRMWKILLFIFKENDGVSYDKNSFPVLNEYEIAKTDVTNVNKVPEEVLIGLISNKNHPQYKDLWSTPAKRETTKAIFRKNVKVTTVNQQVRQTKSTAKLGVEKNVDVTKATDFLALYKTAYETGGFTEEILNAINTLAEKKKITNFLYKNIGVIVDTSKSMTGHKTESKNTPRAIADFTGRVLAKSAKNINFTETEGDITDLASAFIWLLQKEDGSKPYDAIFFVTDGYENSYEGLMNEVLEIYFKETDRNTPVFQISPITGSEMGGNVRKLGENVVTIAINDPVAIQPQITGRLLEIDTKLWLQNQLIALEQINVSRKTKNNVNV